MSCPSFASGAASWARQNEGLVDVAIMITDYTSAVLVGSVFLSPLAASTTSVSLFLTALQADCDVGDAIVDMARRASSGAAVMATLCSIGAFISGVTLNAPLAAAFGGAGTFFGGLASVCGDLSRRRVPGVTALRTMAAGIAVAAGQDNEVVRWIDDVVDAAEDNEQLRALAQAAEENMDEDEDDDIIDDGDGDAATQPTFTWRQTEPPPGFSGSSTSGLFNAYSSAYQTDADEEYQANPSANLRPWLRAQVGEDLYWLTRIRAGYQVSMVSMPGRVREFQRYIAVVDKAFVGLGAWAAAADAPPFGAWSRATLRRVLRSSNLQRNLPVVASPDAGGGVVVDSGGGGGGGGIAALFGLGLAAYAASR